MPPGPCRSPTPLPTEINYVSHRNGCSRRQSVHYHFQFTYGTSLAGSISEGVVRMLRRGSSALELYTPSTLQSRLLAPSRASHCSSKRCIISSRGLCPIPIYHSCFTLPTKTNHVSHRNGCPRRPYIPCHLQLNQWHVSAGSISKWSITHPVSWEFSPRALYSF